jgi:hypothetical protein
MASRELSTRARMSVLATHLSVVVKQFYQLNTVDRAARGHDTFVQRHDGACARGERRIISHIFKSRFRQLFLYNSFSRLFMRCVQHSGCLKYTVKYKNQTNTHVFIHIYVHRLCIAVRNLQFA